MEGNFDTELILAANPNVIFISPSKRGGYDAIKETGITLVPHLGYQELDPLGQAEWIKFVGMFIGKEKEANEVFAGIEKRYCDLKQATSSASFKPTVFSGEMHYGNWHAVGGEALKASEPRNELFKAFKEKKVIYCNMKQQAYYEISPIQPDVLLKDFVAIFHPELVEPDYQPTYYRLLQ